MVAGETWDDVELCEPFVLGSTSNREPFSPSGFLLGEKVPKADEGAFHAYVIRAPSSALGPATVNRATLVKRPPHPPSAPSPPTRNRGGRRALDEGSGKALAGTIQVSVWNRPTAHCYFSLFHLLTRGCAAGHRQECLCHIGPRYWQGSGVLRDRMWHRHSCLCPGGSAARRRIPTTIPLACHPTSRPSAATSSPRG